MKAPDPPRPFSITAGGFQWLLVVSWGGGGHPLLSPKAPTPAAFWHRSARQFFRGSRRGGGRLLAVSLCLMVSVCLSVSATSSFLFPPRVAFTQGVTSAPECLSP